MKKLLWLIIALLLTVSPVVSSLGQVSMANAQSYDEADNYFVEFLSSDATYEGELSFTHSPLYDSELQPHGREYLFTIGTVNGYALMVEFKTETKSFYEIEELFYDKPSPFTNCVGLPVYITHTTYLEYKDQTFYDLVTGATVSAEIISQCAQQGFNYFGGTAATFTTVEDYVEYATKTTTEYSFQYNLPNIQHAVSGGSCAHIAGAIILTYYDRFFENIIPNFVPYYSFGNTIIYKTTNSEINDMMRELVDLMLIGEPHAGTTFSEFQLGMETYVENAGYTYTTTNLFSNGTFNFNNYKNAVESNKPCAIFLTNFAILDDVFTEEEGLDAITCGYCPVSHVLAGCGYRIDTYYDANGNVITTKTYLKAACGTMTYGIGYLNINDGRSTINKAISVLVS